MIEVLKNVVLAAGAFYLIYRIYSSYIQPIWKALHGADRRSRSKERQTKLAVVPQRTSLDMTDTS